MHILADATLPNLETFFPPPFQITRYQDQQALMSALPDHDILLCRSTLLVNQALLTQTPLKVVMTASSGRDHLDELFLHEKKITILDAKGANALAVVEYVLCCLASLRAHEHFQPHTVGIIGVGEVGRRLASALTALHFKVLYYDPIRAAQECAFPQHTLEEIGACDVVCVHPALHQQPPYPSFHLLNSNFLKNRPAVSAIINAARGDVVDESALPLHRGLYCTDVFHNEPHLSPQTIQYATRCTPHIAGHTIEAKIESIRLLSQQLHEHYHLPFPTALQSETQPTDPSPDIDDWEATYLNHYDPWFDTQVLKQTSSLQSTFLLLRKMHRRHQLAMTHGLAVLR